MLEKLVFLAICSLPLYVLRVPIFGLPTTLLEVLIVLSVFFWVFTHFRSGSRFLGVLEAFKTPLFWPSLLLLFFGAVSIFSSSDPWRGLGIYRAFFLEPWLLFHLAFSVYKDKPRQIFNALLLSGWLVALPALWQGLTGQALFSSAEHEVIQGRVASFYNSANSVALYLGPLTALLISYLFKPLFPQRRWFYYLSFLVFVVCLFLTKSLGAWVGISLVFSLYLVFYLVKTRSYLQRVLFQALVLGLFLTSIVFLLFLANISTFTPKTALSYPRPYESTDMVRLCLWEGTRELLLAKPILGAGLNGFPQAYSEYRTCDTELFQYPHNLFLNFWVEVGLGGLLSILVLVGVYWRLISRSSLEPMLKIGIVSFLLYLFFHGLFDVPYFKNDLSGEFWVYLAFGLTFVQKDS